MVSAGRVYTKVSPDPNPQAPQWKGEKAGEIAGSGSGSDEGKRGGEEGSEDKKGARASADRASMEVLR
jgi:hypothetical protein